MANTIAILEQGGNSGTAAEYALEYVNGGKTDWHLPSKDELNELRKHRAIVGGFANDFYRSSSEANATAAWLQDFLNGFQFSTLNKSINGRVRPVRAL